MPTKKKATKKRKTKAKKTGKKKRTRKKRKKTGTGTRSVTKRVRRTRSPLSRASLADLQKEIERRRQQLASYRDELLKEVESVNQELTKIGSLAAAAPSRRGRPPKSGGTARKSGHRRRGRGRNKTNLVDSLQAVLNGKSMSVSEVADAVQKAGYRTKSNNFRTIVNQALIANPSVFKKIDRGVYTAK